MNLPTTIRVCPYCERLQEGVRIRPRNSAYVDDSQNWIDSCGDCYKEDCEYYADLWSDFYSGCM